MRRRRGLAVCVAVPGLLLVGCGQWFAPPEGAVREDDAAAEPSLFPLPPPPPAHPWLEEGVDESFHAISIQGRVEHRRANGRWSPVRVGDELRADEAIRTMPRSGAVLGSRDVGTVEIAQRSELSVKEISRTVARFRLEEGRMSAELAEGGSPLRIEDRSGGVSAEASSGKFVVMSRGDRHMVVGVVGGNVRFSVGASSVLVNPGEQSETRDGAAPSTPHAIPRSLFLKVVQPTEAVQRELRAKLRGETTPGTVVSVNGLSVAADQAGRFEADVPLRDGKNVLVIWAEDPLGRSTSVSLPPIQVKRRVGPMKKTKVIWPEGDR